MGAGRGKTGSANLSTRKDREEYTEQDFGISNNSYIYSEDYLNLEKDLRNVSKNLNDVERQLDSVPKEKNAKDWNKEDEFIFMISGKPPLTEKYKSLMIEREGLQNDLFNLNEKIGNYHKAYAKKYTDIPNTPFTGKSKYFDMRGVQSNNQFSSTAELLKNYSNEGKQARIVAMSPREYIERCSSQIFGGTSYKNTVIGRVRTNKSNIIGYSKAMKKGSKAPLPYLDYTTKGQEGIHRALASMIAGETSIPVLVIS